MKFDSYISRAHVVEMLEAPVRAMLRGDPGAEADPADIIAELDRMDTVSRAQFDLRVNEHAWRVGIIAVYVKIEPAADEELCSIPSRSSAYRGNLINHKAKVSLNGMAFCLTHLKYAQERAEFEAVRDHKDEYVEDEALRAILEADVVVRYERREAARRV